ncbi:NYN domain-containing protein [Massilia antarctica]|uniref:NYN domain-containing protein n=1 Tax=Massilia antarctica TaxID=2765360 RepID=UPI0006BB91D1|nr:NYN domain-containing protein [Massilia sp. H27-R4]MCY0913922.1 NYN domain-containing protein [Massilia sp. H27-R4]CUI04343.1 Maebl [Janthinobacterium sp. CG23_2]CUU28129.1 Maebl [Janthinobacterium sp. CG23_2]
MASSSDNISMAVFCDFENVALGVRDANYEKFDIKPVLERLLLKGSIVVKKAYCDWERYKGFKATMHEANFELIEIPHVRQSGKNSADIRLVVDALDLCYTKSHVNTFVIISGDSDFSPLVSKLRENAKQVIGVGVKQSTSDLLVANCDEFIFYDDLVREVKRAAAKRDERKVQPQPKRSPDEGNRRKEELEARKAQAIDLVVEMFDALVSERGDSGKIWASLLKDTLKRRRPDFNETYYGFRTFGNLLEEAQSRGMLEFGRDEKSGAYVYRSSSAANNNHAHAVELQAPAVQDAPEAGEVSEEAAAKPESSRRGRGRGGRNRNDTVEAAAPEAAEAEEDVAQALDAEPVASVPAWYDPQPEMPDAAPVVPESSRRRGRGGRNRNEPVAEAIAAEAAQPVAAAAAWYDPVPQIEEEELPAEAEVTLAPPVQEKRRPARKPAAKKAAKQADVAPEPAPQPEPEPEPVALELPAGEEASAKPARKAIPRSRRPAKPKAPAKSK